MASGGIRPLRIPAEFWQREPVLNVLRGRNLDSSRDVGGLFTLLRRYAGASQSQIGAAVGLEQVRRVAASDVGDKTLTRLELDVDEFAIGYPVTPPLELLVDVRRHLSFVARLVDARMTLRERRRLLIAGGWLSLLAATVHIDLNHRRAARAHLRTAASLARAADHDEIPAWCLETQAWQALTDGDYPRAVTLAQASQAAAPSGSSAHIQAIAQEGRAWARLGQTRATYDAVDRVGDLVGPMARPDRPEHHYRYDPDKYAAYTATTLAWAGDPAAESYAREVITRLEGTAHAAAWPRRLATARLDLALTLLTTNRLDEACASTHDAIASGRLVPSSEWRALEVVRAVEDRGLPEAIDLREAYQNLRRQPGRDADGRSGSAT